MAWGARNLISTQVSTAETIGDVTMSCKYSKLETEGPDFESRVPVSYTHLTLPTKA